MDITCAGVIASIHPDILLTDKNWKCQDSGPTGWTDLGFDDSNWPNAVEYGDNANGHTSCTDALRVVDISPDAKWIWGDAPLQQMTIFCRGYTVYCETSSPCLNNGTCLQNDERMCDCPAQFTGEFCETEIQTTVDTTAAFTTEQLDTSATSETSTTQVAVIQTTFEKTAMVTTEQLDTSAISTVDHETSTDSLSISRSIFTSQISTTTAAEIQTTVDTTIVSVVTTEQRDTGAIFTVDGETSTDASSISTRILTSQMSTTTIPEIQTTVDTAAEVTTEQLNTSAISTVDDQTTTDVSSISTSIFTPQMSTATNPDKLNETLVFTAFEAVQELYIDGVLQTDSYRSIRSSGSYLPLSLSTRLIAANATNTLNPNCSGVLASISPDFLLTNSKWKCSDSPAENWYELGFDDSSWPSAVEYGDNLNGHSTCPDPMIVPDVSPSAKWIWGEDPHSQKQIYCRGYTAFCDTDSPCMNSGICLLNNETRCQCLPQFTGEFCEVDITNTSEGTTENLLSKTTQFNNSFETSIADSWTTAVPTSNDSASPAAESTVEDITNTSEATTEILLSKTTLFYNSSETSIADSWTTAVPTSTDSASPASESTYKDESITPSDTVSIQTISLVSSEGYTTIENVYENATSHSSQYSTTQEITSFVSTAVDYTYSDGTTTRGEKLKCGQENYCEGPISKYNSSINNCDCPEFYINHMNNCCLHILWIIVITCICVGIVIGIIIVIIYCCRHRDDDSSLPSSRSDRSSEVGSVHGDSSTFDAGSLNGKEDGINNQGFTTVDEKTPDGVGNGVTDVPILAAASHDPEFEDFDMPTPEDYLYNPHLAELLLSDVGRKFKPNMTHVPPDIDYSINRPSMEEESFNMSLHRDNHFENPASFT